MDNKIVKLGNVDFDQIYNSRYVYANTRQARKTNIGEYVFNAITKLGGIKSVIDLGCCRGVILGILRGKGIEVYGVDFADAATRHSWIPNECFALHDLRIPFYPPKRYDLCLSTEVAEHLEEEYADIFCDTLVRCSDKILLTASPHPDFAHLNKQPHQYWIDKITNRGYAYNEDKTNIWRSEIGDERNHVYRDNAMYFEKIK